MLFNPEKHHRRSVRLRGHDYSQPCAFFVTICSWLRSSVFGEIVNSKMELNDYGMVAARAWLHNTNISPHIEFNHFIVMPNHMHGIVIINHRDAILGVRPTQTIGSIIRRYTTTTTRQINIIRNTPGMPVWQNNYHEHMIRNEFELHTIRGHIRNNPVHWAFDKDNPLNIQIDP